MNKLFILFLVIFSLSTCQSDKKLDDNDIYILLQSCYENYYKNYNIEITPLLDQFELQLVQEGRLSDTTGLAYKKMFIALDTTDYFSPPLKTNNFNKILLYKNPSNIINCATTVFSLDSTEVANTHFAKIEEEIQQKVTNSPEVSIHYFFQIYQTKLSKEEIRMPYIKQNILLLLYRWYYISQQKNDPSQEEN